MGGQSSQRFSKKPVSGNYVVIGGTFDVSRGNLRAVPLPQAQSRCPVCNVMTAWELALACDVPQKFQIKGFRRFTSVIGQSIIEGVEKFPLPATRLTVQALIPGRLTMWEECNASRS